MKGRSESLPKMPFAVRPVLIGSVVPPAPVVDETGADTTLAAHVLGEHTVVVFYRGGW